MNYRIQRHQAVSRTPNWPIFMALLLHILLLVSIIYFGNNFAQTAVELPDAVELWQGEAPKIKVSTKIFKPQAFHKILMPKIIFPKQEHAQITLPDTEKNKKQPIVVTKKEKITQKRIEETKSKPKTKPLQKPKTKINSDNLLDLPKNINSNHSQVGKKIGAIDGRLGGGHGTDFSAYKKEVQIRIRAQAKTPFGTEGQRKVNIVVRLDPSMNVLSIRIKNSSGDAAYDQAALDAVRAVGQFPPRPSGSNMDSFRQIELIIRLPNS